MTGTREMRGLNARDDYRMPRDRSRVLRRDVSDFVSAPEAFADRVVEQVFKRQVQGKLKPKKTDSA